MPPVAVERDHDRAEVREALRELPPVQREAIVLAYWGGLTAAQIAQRSGVPLGTAKSRYPSRSAPVFATCCRCSRRPPAGASVRGLTETRPVLGKG